MAELENLKASSHVKVSPTGTKQTTLNLLKKKSVLGIFPDILTQFVDAGSLHEVAPGTVLQAQRKFFGQVLIPIDQELLILVSTGIAVDSVVVETAKPASILGLFEILGQRVSQVTIACDEMTLVLSVPASEVRRIMNLHRHLWKVLRLLVSSKAITQFALDFLAQGYAINELVEILDRLNLTSERIDRFTRLESGSSVYFVQTGTVRGLSEGRVVSYGAGYYWHSGANDALKNLNYLESTFIHELQLERLKPAAVDRLLKFFAQHAAVAENIVLTKVTHGLPANLTEMIKYHESEDRKLFPILNKLDLSAEAKKSKEELPVLVSIFLELNSLSIDFKATKTYSELIGFESPASLARFVERYGLVTRQATDTVSLAARFPVWCDFKGSPVVLVGQRRGRYYGVDSAQRLFSISSADFRNYSSLKYVFVDSVSSDLVKILEGKGPKAKNQIGTQFFRHQENVTARFSKSSLMFGVFFAFMALLYAPALSMIYGRTFEIKSNEFTGILLVALGFVAVFQMLSAYLGHWFQGILGSQSSFSIYSIFCRQFLSSAGGGQLPLGASFLAKPFQFDFLQQLRNSLAVKGPGEIVLMVLVLSCLALHSITSSFVVLLLLTISIFISFLLVRRRLDLFSGFNQGQVLVLEYLSEYLTAFSSIKSFSVESRIRERVEKQFMETQALDLKIQLAERTRRFVIQIFASIALAGAFCAVVVDYQRQQMSAGSLVLVGVLLTLIHRPFFRISEMVSNYMLAKMSGDGLLPPIPPSRQSNVSNEISVTLHGDIFFDKVSYRYPSTQRPAVNDVSFQIKAGQVVAVVGKSGSGKTTMAKLLGAQILPSSGRIVYGGADSREISVGNLRDQIGYVAQDSKLFSGSLAENISYADDSPKFEKIRNVSRSGQSRQFIRALENQYQYQLDENGHGLSGGEKNLMALSRALYRNPRILVLDEVTSYLDPQAEKLLCDSISRDGTQMTVIYVVHRMNIAKRADVILVMNNGVISEIGNHEELIRRNGEYTELYRHQIGIEEV